MYIKVGQTIMRCVMVHIEHEGAGVPVEINDHLRIFGKNADEVDYDSNGQCPFCGSRIDEFNFCACGGKMGVD